MYYCFVYYRNLLNRIPGRELWLLTRLVTVAPLGTITRMKIASSLTSTAQWYKQLINIQSLSESFKLFGTIHITSKAVNEKYK